MRAIFIIAVLLLPALAIAVELDPQARARLASLKNEGEGQRLTEALLQRGDVSGTDTQRRITEAALRAQPYLEASVRAADWNDTQMGLDGPACFDAAPKLGLLFRALGVPGYVAAAGHHVFLVAEAEDVTLLIDPTIRQYFGQDSAPDWVPKVFVGTLSELRALYEREPGLPNLPYRAIYFNAEWPASRRDSKMLTRRNLFLRQASSREHAPLTEYFNACVGSPHCAP